MPSGYELAARDPALAALMGAIPGADFGYAYGGADFGDDYGFGHALSAFDPSMNIGVDYGFGANPPPPAPAPAPAPAAYHPAYGWHHPGHMGHPGMHHPGHMGYPGMHHPGHHPWHHPGHLPYPGSQLHHPEHGLGNPASTTSRTLLLDPNRDSAVKVERYSFSFSPVSNLVLGTASSIPTFTQQPNTSIKGQRVVANAPIQGFIYLSSLQIANVNVFVGGTEDAYTYSSNAVGVMLDLPRLDPQNRATASGNYSGALPPGFTAGNSFMFVITLQGPSTLAGGYGQ